jgi:hypothetical protein
MNELETKKLVANRIVSHLTQVPANAMNELLKEPLASLEEILDKLATKREHERIQQDAQAQIDEMRAASRADGGWAHCLLKVRLNNKVLADTEANRQMMESMLAPHESPSAAIYETVALSYPQKFAWIAPQRVQTEAERRADFERICRENLLSLNGANEQLYREGVAIDNWSGASGVERQRFTAAAAQARQKYLINTATPDELKAEARYQFQTEHAAAVQADAARREKFVAETQKGLYPILPGVNGRGEAMDAGYFRRISTVDYNLFKALVKRHGSAQITARLRGEN